MNRRLCWIVLVACVVGLLPVGSGVRGAEFSALMRRVPGEANVLVLVDVERVFASPIARERGWQKKVAAEGELHSLLLPPGARKLVRAITLDLDTSEMRSELTLLDLPKGPALEKVAARHQGYVEQIANTEAAWFPQGAFGVKLAADQYALMFPANRQSLSRWLRERNGQASTWLLQSATQLKARGPQLVLALDLEGAVPTKGLEERLKQSATLGPGAANVAEMARVIGSARGAYFTVEFGEGAIGTLVVEFERDAAPLGEVGKGVLLGALANHGVAVDELADWQVKVTGKSLSLTGTLTDSGLMRLSSVVELPSDLIDDPEEKTDAGNPQLYATQAHYKAVQRLTDDLFAKKKQSFGQYAQWAEQYAKKIDRLPLLNVDEEMQQYSAQVAELLRQGAVAFRGVGIRSAGRQSQVWTSNYVNYGYSGNRWYAGNYNAGEQEKRSIRGEEVSQGATDAASMKQQIDDASAEIRRKMVAKYKVEF